MSDSARRTVRTIVALVLGALPGLPLLVHTAGLPSTLPGLGTVLAAAAAITRILALPAVDAWMPSWLRMTPPKAELSPITAPLVVDTAAVVDALTKGIQAPPVPPTASRE
ncbi:hypothetical protein ABZW30_12350 [Kitasatospora sp. NPDC004669]|uniref:hypothetical protein n=1 Tax=Kitasatospora sp. NPDC004669 TaxID=3154555 RepID=UPI0033A54569